MSDTQNCSHEEIKSRLKTSFSIAQRFFPRRLCTQNDGLHAIL